MNQRVLAISILISAIGACASHAGFWRFEEGKAGETAGVVTAEGNPAAIAGKAGVCGTGVPPAYDADVPHKELWNGIVDAPAVPANEGSLRFKATEDAAGAAPVGGEVVVSGKDALTHPESFTLEAFVKIAAHVPRHALIASKRRNGQSGASWSLSITPSGALSVRFDTEQGDGAERVGQFNQCFTGTAVPADGAWHHVAMVFDRETRGASLYLNYRRCGGGTVAGPLVYDDSDFIIGRGLDGWLDEVRLTPEALHHEQFLRPTRFFTDMKPETPATIPLLDQTPTRVQSALKPDLKRIGTLVPKPVDQLETPTWSLGCETLDRDLASWSAYRGYLVPLGIKRIRLQGGWNRTEKKKGEYDFEWLDRIVDDAIELGLEVCLETSYNNKLYEPGGALGPGGRLPEGEETLAAWDRWVEAMVRHYAPKGVKEWMMYNEPNLNKENTLEKIVANNVRTAEIIKRVDPDAKIGAFVLAGLNLDAIKTMLQMIKEQGKLNLFHWAIYHGYSGNPDRLNPRMAEFNAMLADVAPNIRPWQGEAGCASEEVQYALSGIDWTEYSHAKWNARRMLCDVGHGIESSVFTISDVSYHKDFISRYGLLKTNPDNSVIKVKTAYYTVQNVVTLFNDALERVPDYNLTIAGTEKELTWFAFRDRKTGLDVVALWDGIEIPSNASDLETVQVIIQGGHFKDPVWIDLVTGNIYEIPAEQMTTAADTVTFRGVPVYDSPGVITDRSLLDFVPAREKKGSKKPPAPKPKSETAKGGEHVTPHLLPGTQQPAPAVLILGMGADATEALVKWLAGQEVHAFVLETSQSVSPEKALHDAEEALRYIRSRAAEWQVKTNAVGVLGIGTGGPLASTLADTNADFAILLDMKESDGAPVGKKRVFVGKPDVWQAPLAAWLEQFKGKVF